MCLNITRFPTNHSEVLHTKFRAIKSVFNVFPCEIRRHLSIPYGLNLQKKKKILYKLLSTHCHVKNSCAKLYGLYPTVDDMPVSPFLLLRIMCKYFAFNFPYKSSTWCAVLVHENRSIRKNKKLGNVWLVVESNLILTRACTE